MGRTRRLLYVYLLGISKVCIWNRVCMVAAVIQHKKWNNSSIYKTRKQGGGRIQYIKWGMYNISRSKHSVTISNSGACLLQCDSGLAVHPAVDHILRIDGHIEQERASAA